MKERNKKCGCFGIDPQDYGAGYGPFSQGPTLPPSTALNRIYLNESQKSIQPRSLIGIQTR